MHAWQIDSIIANAFNGLGDSTGDDDFGVSVAWIDLHDYIAPMGIPGEPVEDDDYQRAILAYMGSTNRYALAFIHADGRREVDGYETDSAMREVYRLWDADYRTFLDSTDA